MSTFKQAIKWLKEGKKVRRPKWKGYSYWVLVGDYGRICYSDGEPARIHIDQLEKNDWELYKDKPKLRERSFSEKMAYIKAQFDTGLLTEEMYRIQVSAILEVKNNDNN